MVFITVMFLITVTNFLAKTPHLETQRAHSPGLFNLMYGALSTTVKFGSQVVQKTAGSISPRALITSTWDKSITSHSLKGFSSIFVNILG